MVSHDAEARMPHKTIDRCKVTFFSSNVHVFFCYFFVLITKKNKTGVINLSARKTASLAAGTFKQFKLILQNLCCHLDLLGCPVRCAKIEYYNSEVHVGNCRTVSAKA